MNRVLLFVLSLFILSCGNPQKKIIDQEHKTFYVNGVSAQDGYKKVSRSLKDMGFKIGKDGVMKSDLTYFGMGLSYYANYHAKSLTKEQASRLTYGLFENLPSGIVYDDDDGKWRVFLKWYQSGEIKSCLITFNEFMPLLDEDAIEINKRLSAMFPHSRVSNSYMGYKTYYDDNGIEIYFPNSFTLEVEKK